MVYKCVWNWILFWYLHWLEFLKNRIRFRWFFKIFDWKGKYLYNLSQSWISIRFVSLLCSWKNCYNISTGCDIIELKNRIIIDYCKGNSEHSLAKLFTDVQNGVLAVPHDFYANISFAIANYYLSGPTYLFKADSLKFFSEGIGLLSTRPGLNIRIDDPNSTYIVEIGEPMILAAAFHSLFGGIFF